MSWAILQTRHEKGHLCVRSAVLFWNQQISRRATIPSWYFWGLFNMPAFKNSFLGALPPTVGLSFFQAGSSPIDINGPASVAICASCLVGDDSGNCPTSSTLLASSFCLSISPWVGGLLVSSRPLVLDTLFLSWPITPSACL